MPRTTRFSLLPLLLLLPMSAACSTTSAAFVEGRPGFAVTKGRLLEVDGLSSRKVTALADGAAFELEVDKCRVVLRFDDGREQRLELAPPAVLVCGAATDYVMQPADRGSVGSTPSAPSRQ